FGGPDGGDGGNGGNVYVVGDRQLSTLHSLWGKRHWRAQSGGHGAGKKMHGKRGKDLLIRVPLGTVVYRRENGEKVAVADVAEEGEKRMVVRGGRGGYGNARFATSTNQAPRMAQKGEPGEETHVVLELKLIADAGIIGYPSVGKSTLLAAASAARPRIAEYPFTTKEPVLGVVEVGNRSFVLAEIPGLIEGAHAGAGLGDEFLRHAERTKLLIHVVDGASGTPLADFENVNRELALYSPALAGKSQIVAVNKIDLPDVKARIAELQTCLRDVGVPLHFISAATTEGIQRLMQQAAAVLDRAEVEEKPEGSRVFHPQPSADEVSVRREGEVFVVSCPKAESLVERMDCTKVEARAYLRRQLGRWGVVRALRRAGVKPGDTIRIGSMEMEWQ
ncbi:MAG: GTPase ObgE, partial [Chloroflexota bacterium]